MTNYLCYYELHVEDKTYYLSVLVDATSSSKALDKLGKSYFGKYHHLQPKGCLGKFNLKTQKKFLKEVGGGRKIE